MNSLSVLLYNCSGPQWSKLYQIMMLLRMRIRIITPQLYQIPVGQLATGKWDPSQECEPGEPFPQAMMVFCGISGKQFGPILAAIREAKLPPIPLKAILTPTNAQWDSRQLYEELCREREALEQARAQDQQDKK